jgi:hypothetical protein
VVECSPESYRPELVRLLRLVSKKYLAFMNLDFDKQHFRKLVVRFQDRSMQRFVWVAKNTQFKSCVRKLTINTKSILIMGGPNDIVNRHSRYFHAVTNCDTFRTALPTLSNLEELIIDQPGNITDVPGNTTDVHYSHVRRLEALCSRLMQQFASTLHHRCHPRLRVLNILGVDGSSCTLGRPVVLGVAMANSVIPIRADTLTELAISTVIDEDCGMIPYRRMQDFANT